MPTGKCPHGEFELEKGCPKCIEEARILAAIEANKAIDESRVEHNGNIEKHSTPSKSGLGKNGIYGKSSREQGANSDTRYHNTGRWPANLIHDGSDEVLENFPYTKSGTMKPTLLKKLGYHGGASGFIGEHQGDEGSAARFFYCVPSW